MTQILTTKNVAKKITATASDEKYNYNVEYSINNNGNTLEQVSVVACNISNNDYAATVTLQGNSDRTINAKEGADITTVNNMYNAILAEIKSTLSVQEV